MTTEIFTVKELKEYLSQFSDDTKVRVGYWDCYNDGPAERSVHAYIKGNKRKTIYL